MKLYKLTDAKDQTYGQCQWGKGVTHQTSGKGALCGPGFTHWYTDPLLAVLLNPIHGQFDLKTGHLWEGEGHVAIDDHGLKVGCTKATTQQRVPLPRITLTQRVAFSILCALEVYCEPDFVKWATEWLSGMDRSESKAHAAVNAAYTDYAAAAAYAANAADAAADAADYAAYAADAADYAANAAAYAALAYAAANVGGSLDLVNLARKALTYDS